MTYRVMNLAIKIKHSLHTFPRKEISLSPLNPNNSESNFCISLSLEKTVEKEQRIIILSFSQLFFFFLINIDNH